MNKVFDIGASIVVLAMIYVLVRPNSQGPKLVTSIGNSFGSTLKAATGGGSW